MHKKITAPIFVFLGPPGSGKGTQAKKLAKALLLPHISTGDLIRAYSAGETELAQKLRRLVDEGLFVPDETIVELLVLRVQDKDCQEGFILDGFPRNALQAQILDRSVEKLDQLIFLNVILDDDTILERLSGRRTCQGCSKIYHIEYAPSKEEESCDDCDHPLFIRKDDQNSVILNRLRIFKEAFKSIKNYYYKRPLWIDLPASGTSENCFSNLIKKITEKVPHLMLNTSLT